MKKKWPVLAAAAVLVAGAGTYAVASNTMKEGAHRITFPHDYKQTFVRFYTSDRADNNQVRDLYASLRALDSARDGAPLDHGSQFVMEIYDARLDADGEPVLDSEGRFQKAGLKLLAVMEKGMGWGASYDEEIRNGDWEYGFFNLDGTLKADVDTRPCRECHLPFAEDDYVIFFEELHAKAGG